MQLDIEPDEFDGIAIWLTDDDGRKERYATLPPGEIIRVDTDRVKTTLQFADWWQSIRSQIEFTAPHDPAAEITCYDEFTLKSLWR